MFFVDFHEFQILPDSPRFSLILPEFSREPERQDEDLLSARYFTPARLHTHTCRDTTLFLRNIFGCVSLRAPNPHTKHDISGESRNSPGILLVVEFELKNHSDSFSKSRSVFSEKFTIIPNHYYKGESNR